MENKYILTCPHCSATLDVEKEIVKWKLEVVEAFERLEEIVKLLNKTSRKAGGKHDRKTSTEH